MKHDPNAVARYTIKKRKYKGSKGKDNRYAYSLRLPDYIFEHVRKEAADHQKSINTVIIEMIEAALSPE